MNIFNALRKHYAPPSWAYFEEVRNGTGWVKNERYADGLAMSLWPSRGMEVHGIEVKTSRKDWLQELKDPAKAEAIFKYCDRWWLAVSEEEITKKEEIPKTWGLYVFRGGKLKVVKQAPTLKPKSLDRPFIASILRRMCETNQKALNAVVGPLVTQAIEERLEEEKARWHRNRGRETDDMKRSFDNLKYAVQTFEESSGIKIDEAWQAGRVGKAVKEVLVRQDASSRLQHLRKAIDEIAKQLQSIPAE